MKRHAEIDMVHGPLLKNMWIFALPIIAMNLLQLLFNAADMVVVCLLYTSCGAHTAG